MPFQKGNNLSNGRPKGKPNKMTAQLKDKFQYIMNQIVDSIDIDEMDIEHKMRFISIASQYVMPKLRQVDEVDKTDNWNTPKSVLIYTRRDPVTGEWEKREEKISLPDGDRPTIVWKPADEEVKTRIVSSQEQMPDR